MPTPAYREHFLLFHPFTFLLFKVSHISLGGLGGLLLTSIVSGQGKEVVGQTVEVYQHVVGYGVLTL